MSDYNSLKYLLDDYSKILFPLSTTKILVENNGKEILEDYIYQKILNQSEQEHSFLSQVRCYSSKHGLHLRRTVKLDPVAELFIYDLIYRNRVTFRKDFNANRRSFGYRFQNGKPISPTQSYADFKQAIGQARLEYKFSIKFDISSYFNSIYHHDLVAWFSEANRDQNDVEAFGQFLREINGGRTVDCLPQGLHPCKVVGAEFLKFIDNSIKTQSELLLRFMDDFYLFSDNEKKINSDFIIIQKILGEKGLSLNSAKTLYGNLSNQDLVQTVDDIKVGLLQLRRQIIDVSGFPSEDLEKDEDELLTDDQIEYLLDLLKDPDIDESNAELVLLLLHDNENEVLEKMDTFLKIFPSLSRNIYNFCRDVSDVDTLSDLLLQFLKNGTNATEDQLFWIAKISEDFLSKTPKYADILSSLYEHPNATVISRAKVIEIPENRFGMGELRREHLRVGKSDWLAWASAVGCRSETPISRNHILSYFSKASPMNKLVADCVKNLP
jgi:hypothetical protein